MSWMVRTRLKETRLWRFLRDSESLHLAVRWLDRKVHYRLGTILKQPASGRTTFEDRCSLHGEREAPPAGYDGVPSPLSAEPGEWEFDNPVVSAGDVTDYGNVDYIADPFLLLGSSVWMLYFEVYNNDRDPPAVIARATSTDGGSTWQYDGIVLDTGVHTSFPYVFRHRGTVWMLPNLNPPDSVGDVRLYRSSDGGAQFEDHVTIAEPDDPPTDRVVFRWHDRWWLFLSVSASEHELYVYHSESLTAPEWTPHVDNPVVVGEPRIPGGRPVVLDDQILMFFQNGPNHYGEVVEAVEITDLSTSTYADRPLGDGSVVGPVGSAVGWNSARMHTFDPWYTGERWVCAVDGDTELGQSLVGPHWSIGLYSIPASRDD